MNIIFLFKTVQIITNCFTKIKNLIQLVNWRITTIFLSTISLVCSFFCSCNSLFNTIFTIPIFKFFGFNNNAKQAIKMIRKMRLMFTLKIRKKVFTCYYFHSFRKNGNWLRTSTSIFRLRLENFFSLFCHIDILTY